MKNQIQNLKLAPVYLLIKALLFSSIAFADLTLHSQGLENFHRAVALAGNGAGYNGPDRSGVAIPVVLERGIKASNVEKAYGTCLGEGDASTGRVGLFKKLMLQVHGHEVPLAIRNQSPIRGKWVFYSTKVDYLAGGVVRFTQGVYGVANSHFAEMKPLINALTPAGGISIGLKMTHPDPKVNDRWIEMGSIDDNGSIGTLVFPVLKYSHLTTQPKYDEWGVVQGDDEAVLAGLVLSGPAPSTDRKLVNLKTKVELPISINEQEIIDCLVDELQRRAE